MSLSWVTGLWFYPFHYLRPQSFVTSTTEFQFFPLIVFWMRQFISQHELFWFWCVWHDQLNLNILLKIIIVTTKPLKSVWHNSSWLKRIYLVLPCDLSLANWISESFFKCRRVSVFNWLTHIVKGSMCNPVVLIWSTPYFYILETVSVDFGNFSDLL